MEEKSFLLIENQWKHPWPPWSNKISVEYANKKNLHLLFLHSTRQRLKLFFPPKIIGSDENRFSCHSILFFWPNLEKYFSINLLVQTQFICLWKKSKKKLPYCFKSSKKLLGPYIFSSNNTFLVKFVPQKIFPLSFPIFIFP